MNTSFDTHRGRLPVYCKINDATILTLLQDAECALRKLNGKIVLSQALRVRWAEETMRNDKICNLPKGKDDIAQNKMVEGLR